MCLRQKAPKCGKQTNICDLSVRILVNYTFVALYNKNTFMYFKQGY